MQLRIRYVQSWKGEFGNSWDFALAFPWIVPFRRASQRRPDIIDISRAIPNTGVALLFCSG
jgi:hypothetical protein